MDKRATAYFRNEIQKEEIKMWQIIQRLIRDSLIFLTNIFMIPKCKSFSIKKAARSIITRRAGADIYLRTGRFITEANKHMVDECVVKCKF